jgi:hypothetical protein
VVSPQLTLQIGADPRTWFLDDANYEVLSAQLSEAAAPIAVPVFAPLAGRLLLNTIAAGSVWLGEPGYDSHGTHPTDDRLPGAPPFLYVPSANPAIERPSGFYLDPGTDLAALEQRIAAAMVEDAVVSVQVSTVYGIGSIVLSGASLAYCVICPSKRPGPLTG